METATHTNQRSTQRVRIVAPTDTNKAEMSCSTPLALAESFIRSSVSSLQPELCTIVEKLGKEHILLLCKLDNKKTILKKLTDNEDVIPRSARIEFKLSGSKRTEQRPEFIALAEETSTLVIGYRKALRGQVIKSLKIEIISIKEEVREHLLKAIRLIAQSFMIIKKDSSNVDFKVHTLMEFYLGTLTKHCLIKSPQFLILYKKIHGLEVFPPPAPTGANPLDLQQDIVPDDIEKLNTTIKSIFVTPWTKYKQQQESNTVTLALKNLSAGYFTDRDTAVAVATVDLEPAADRPELQALIRKETQAENQTLRKELHSLKQQINGLKKPPIKKPQVNVSKKINVRGQGVGASAKTNHNPKQTSTNRKGKGTNSNNKNQKTHAATHGRKKNQQQQQKDKQKQNQNQKADGNNNVTGSNIKKRKTNDSSNSSQPNKNTSSKRRKQSSATSNGKQN
jgi:hypothetical protein